MREKMTWMRLLMMSLLAAALILGGCGDDGKDGRAGVDGSDGTDGMDGIDGTDGVPGPPGTPGKGLTIKALEVHEAINKVSWDVTNVAGTATGAVIEVNIKVDDLNRNDFGTVSRAYAYAEATNPDYDGFMLGTLSSDDVAVVNNGSGNYTITAPRPDGQGWDGDITWFVILNTGDTYPAASIVAHQTESGEAVRNIVSDQACINCHGDNIFTTATNEMGSDRNYHNTAFSVESCTVCHQREGRDNLPRYAHGIHNSNSLNGGNNASSITIKNNWEYSVRYPAIVVDCAGCHDSDEALDFVLAQPISFELCMGCHGGSYDTERAATATSPAVASQAWRGFSDNLPLGHLDYNATTNCASCHGDGGYISSANHSAITLAENCAVCHFQGNPPAFSASAHATFTQTATCGSCHAAAVGGAIGTTVADYHSGYSDRGLAQKVADDYFFIAIEGVVPTVNVGEYQITWSAINPATGSAYNVCGTTAVADLGNVTFTPVVRLAYFEPNGDDITNPIGNNPGQPDGTQALLANSVCNAGVVTSTFVINAGLAPEITRVLALLKPQATVTADPALALQGSGRVRIPVASYAFDIADGAFSPRRAIVDSAKCIACHGANLYNHGDTGGRFDNVDSCIACHNSGATDQYVRAVLDFNGAPLTAATSFDNKEAESFSLAYNMHAIHAAGVTDAPYFIYRTRGVYGYGGENTEPQNWLFEDGVAVPYISTTNPSNPVTWTRLVAGVEQTSSVPVYLKKVDYPRALTDCSACHFEGTYDVPNQSKMVAVSLDSGLDLAVQNDDELLGPASAACMSCHNSNDAFLQRALYNHADRNGFAPQVFDNGKQDVLNFVEIEGCVICH